MNFTIITCVNFICKCKVCKEHQFINHVNSIITFASCLYMYMPFNYPWSLLVIVWLLLVPTNITGSRGNQTVHEGDNLQLACEVLGRPEPNIAWTREEPGNQGNTFVVQEGKVLTTTNVNRTDAGDYTCTAYNGFGKPENQTVYVTVTCKYGFKKKTLTNAKHRCNFLILFSVF